MSTVTESVDVHVPIGTAYNQWTQFEDFPKFMDGVESVRQLDDKTLYWKAKIAGKTEEWEARIAEQIPDKRIAWHNIAGATNAGQVDFVALSPVSTRVSLTLEYDPQGAVENVGDALGFVKRQVEGDLRRFKQFVEERGSSTGAWRGEIKNRDAA